MYANVETEHTAALLKKLDDFLTTSQVARRLRVNVTTVLRWIKSGALEAVTLPYRSKQCYRVPKSAIEKLINGGKEATQ